MDTSKISAEQLKKFGYKHLKEMKSVEVFELGGTYFLGYPPEVIKHYASCIPNGDEDFYAWVADHYPMLNRAPRHERAHF